MSKGGGKPGARTADEEGSLAAAAIALEAEMRRFEHLTEVATRGGLDSQKQIENAAEALEEAASCHTRFGEQLRALVTAVNDARDRQQASAAALNARAEQIAKRRAEFDALRERFGTLGEASRAINQQVQNAVAQARAAGPVSAAARAELGGQLAEACVRLDEVVAGAQAIVADARATGAEDLARQADSLRQQVQAARNRLGLLQQQFAGEPS